MVSNVGRIMETDLGVQFFGEERCTRCIEAGHQCWVYTDKGRGQIKNPGSACARCRANPHPTIGCSLARRRPKQKFPRDPPPNRFILPKGGGEGPGAGGMGMVVWFFMLVLLLVLRYHYSIFWWVLKSDFVPPRGDTWAMQSSLQQERRRTGVYIFK
jgi:hypothetical protein